METPKYLQVLWGYKWLLLFGAIVAGAAAFFAGFTIQNGEVVSRAEQTWDASTTMLITSDSDPIYQAEIPGVPLEQGVSAPQYNDLAESALIYAYIIASDEIQTQVEAQIGTLDPEKESISAVRRTTQPAGDERFPGRYELPVLEAVGTAPTAERAELISQTVAAAFVGVHDSAAGGAGPGPHPRGEGRAAGREPGGRGRHEQPCDPDRRHLHRRVPRLRRARLRHRRPPVGRSQAACRCRLGGDPHAGCARCRTGDVARGSARRGQRRAAP